MTVVFQDQSNLTLLAEMAVLSEKMIFEAQASQMLSPNSRRSEWLLCGAILETPSTWRALNLLKSMSGDDAREAAEALAWAIGQTVQRNLWVKRLPEEEAARRMQAVLARMRSTQRNRP